ALIQTPSTPGIGAGAPGCGYVAPGPGSRNNEAAADVNCPVVGGVQFKCYSNNRCGDPAIANTRNPARLSCTNPCRQALINTYGNVFTDFSSGHRCRSG